MSWRYRVPGRIELVGKHTDYVGGPSLTCATPFHMHATAHAISEKVIRVHDQRNQATVEMPIVPQAAPSGLRWTVYLAAVARRLARDFPEVHCGVEMTLGSTIPTAMGMSSSSALVISLAMPVFDANGLWETPAWRSVANDELAFAQYCAAIESGTAWGPFAGDSGVGTRGGAQDHIAICASRRSTVGMYEYLPGRVIRRVAWPRDWRIVVANSGVKASKTGNAMQAYNRVADSVRALVGAWNASTGRSDATLADALRSSSDAFDHIRSLADGCATGTTSAEYLRDRVAQYREETSVIAPGMADAIANADVAKAGEMMRRSQEMAERALQNQVPQTVWLAAHAAEHGAVAATAFGAGFGGAVWALVAAGEANRFASAWMKAFGRAHKHDGGRRPERARVLAPSGGAWRRMQ